MVKRVLCMVAGHNGKHVRYPGSPDGYFLKCLRCGKRREEPPGSGDVTWVAKAGL